MSARPPSPDPETLALAQRAAELESQEQWAGAAVAWSSVAAREPNLIPAQLRLAQARIRAGQPGDAIVVLEPLTVRAPDLAAAWLALGVAYSLVDRHGDAVRAGARAATLAPGVPAAHLGLGDILLRDGDPRGAEGAYRQALALSPGHPDALTKLAALARAEGRRDDAEALLTGALAGTPDHPYARINLAMIAIRRHRVDEARRLLEAVLASPALAPEVRTLASESLAAIAERERLRTPVDAALASKGPLPIELALRSIEPPEAVDEALLAAISTVVERAAGTPSIEARFTPRRVPSAAWPAIEAHHCYVFDDDPNARARSARLVAGAEPPASPKDLDVVHYASVAATRPAAGTIPPDGIACEAWLRWTHARLVRHRDDYWPGLLNPLGNARLGGSDHARTPPRAIAGTLRHAFADIGSRLPPGGRRAAAALLAILWIHPFLNGNKRLARAVANHELAAAGFMPHLNLAGADREVYAIAHEARRTRDAQPLALWLAAATHRAAERDARYALDGVA